MSVNLFKKIIGCQQLSYINFYYVFSIKSPQLLRDLTVLLVKNKVKKRLEEYDFLAWPQSEKFSHLAQRRQCRQQETEEPEIGIRGIITKKLLIRLVKIIIELVKMTFGLVHAYASYSLSRELWNEKLWSWRSLKIFQIGVRQENRTLPTSSSPYSWLEGLLNLLKLGAFDWENIIKIIY